MEERIWDSFASKRKFKHCEWVSQAYGDHKALNLIQRLYLKYRKFQKNAQVWNNEEYIESNNQYFMADLTGLHNRTSFYFLTLPSAIKRMSCLLSQIKTVVELGCTNDFFIWQPQKSTEKQFKNYWRIFSFTFQKHRLIWEQKSK